MATISESLKQSIHDSWGWLTTLGGVMMLFGVLILASPMGLFTASLTVEILTGIGFVTAGILQLINGWKDRHTSSGKWIIFSGVLFTFGGLFLLSHPAAGLVSLVLAIGSILIVDGIMKFFLGLSLKGMSGRGWLFVSAVASILLGGMLLTNLPASASLSLGLLVGVSILMQGISFVILGLSARKV